MNGTTEEGWKPAAGDIVKFKSGGPPMTVGNAYKNSRGIFVAECYWFPEGESSQHSADFPAAILKKVE